MAKFKERFKPNMFIDDIYSLDLERMKKLKIKAFLFDIDNTLVTYDDIIAPVHTREWFKLLHENGFLTYLISNNRKERVETFGKSLGEPYFYAALKPKLKYMKKACDKLGVEPSETALVGDQLFTDIYGGNRMGMYTIFVKAISDKEDAFVHFKRNFEKRILKEWL